MTKSRQSPKKRRATARRSSGIVVLTFDFQSFLKRITSIGGWKEHEGPDSGVGIDYWYRSGNHEAYINIDQAEMTVSVDGEVVFQGSANQALVKEE